MKVKNGEPSEAQMLAAHIKSGGAGGLDERSATIQRSHRFPAHLLKQIEQMARASNRSTSFIINQLLNCGLEAVNKELSGDSND